MKRILLVFATILMCASSGVAAENGVSEEVLESIEADFLFPAGVIDEQLDSDFGELLDEHSDDLLEIEEAPVAESGLFLNNSSELEINRRRVRDRSRVRDRVRVRDRDRHYDRRERDRHRRVSERRRIRDRRGDRYYRDSRRWRERERRRRIRDRRWDRDLRPWIICYAEDSYGQRYSAIGRRGTFVQDVALNRCYEWSRVCYRMGCSIY